MSGRLNFEIASVLSRVIAIQLIDPEDTFLVSAEALIIIGLFIAVILAYMIHKRHSSIATGWNFILFGMISLLAHSIFDMLDTFQWDDLVVDVLNVLDGFTFCLGLLLLALGIYKIAEFGAKKWGL
jgi:hypothetical protein